MSVSFLAPQLLWSFLAVPVVILLHFIRKRRKKRQVSALFLWKEAVIIAQKQKRFSPSWLLLLQILFVSLAALALAQPVLSFKGPSDRIFIVDASASMAAQDPDGVRIDKAIAAADELLAKSGRVAIIRAGLDATIVSPLSDNLQDLRRALKSIKASDREADLLRALSIAKTISEDAEIHFFSDVASPKGEKIIAHGISSPSLNIGISAFDIGIQEAFVAVTSNHPRPQDIQVVLLRDGKLIAQSSLFVPSKGQATTSFPIFENSGLFELKIEAPDWDSLSIDNAAYIAKNDLNVVSLVDNEALGRSLAVIPNLNYRILPNANINAPGFDLRIIYDQLPADAKGNYLLFNQNNDGELSVIKDWDRSDPLLRFVDLSEVVVSPQADFIDPGWQVLAQSNRLEPIISKYKDQNVNLVALNFNPSQTNMTKRTAFPLLMTNIISHFRNEGQLILGQKLAADSVLMQGEREIKQGYATSPGFYKIDNKIYAVSLLSSFESKLDSFSPEKTTIVENNSTSQINRSLAWWLVLLALVFIFVEWFLWSQANKKINLR
ncbi:MAG TPA: VWA domain-containing protein [Trueperaceae bacterium]|nr:VWA domain-containing protein [Trueperaceae bacterium]